MSTARSSTWQIVLAFAGWLWSAQLCAQSASLQVVESELLDAVPTLRMRGGDLNRDGLVDLAALQFDSSGSGMDRVVIQSQQPTGAGEPVRFHTEQVLPADLPQDLALLDIDRDGDLDLLLVQDRADQALVIWLNADGVQQGRPGYFQRHNGVWSGDLMAAVRALRLNAGGPRDDLLLVGSVGRPSRVYQNFSSPGFLLLVPGQSIPHPGAIGAEIGDLNGDGKDDLILYGTQTRIVLNVGPASDPMVATASDPFAGVGTVFAASLIDLDNDNDLDLILATGVDDRVFRHDGLDGNGEPRYQLVQTLNQGPPGVTREFAWVDVDGDQIRDLIAARDNTNAPAGLRGSPVYRRLAVGLDFAPTPLQRVSPSATMFVASPAPGAGDHLWLGSSDPLYNALWRSAIAAPITPITTIGATVGPSGVNGYYYGDRIAAQVRILPGAAEPTTVVVDVSGDQGAVLQSSVTLATGEPAQRVSATVPAQPNLFERWRFQIAGISPATAANVGLPDQAVIATVPNPFSNTFEMQCYIACVMLSVCAEPGLAQGDAPAGETLLMGTPAEVQLLRRLRDERLASSQEGLALIELYQNLQLDLYLATFAEPSFYGDLWRLKDAWMPAVSSLVDGDGSLPVSAEMQQRLNAVLLRFELLGTEALRAAIHSQRVSLQLDRLQDRPVADFQLRWEQGPVFADGFD